MKTELATQGLQAQALLVPRSLEVSRVRPICRAVRGRAPSRGARLARRGPNQSAVRAVPMSLEGGDFERSS